MLDISTEDGAVLLPVKVVPGASRTRYLGEWEKRVRIAVASPPEKGKANKAVVAFVARSLGVRKSDVTVISGLRGSVKTIRIERVDAEQVLSAFQPDRS